MSQKYKEHFDPSQFVSTKEPVYCIHFEPLGDELDDPNGMSYRLNYSPSSESYHTPSPLPGLYHDYQPSSSSRSPRPGANASEEISTPHATNPKSVPLSRSISYTHPYVFFFSVKNHRNLHSVSSSLSNRTINNSIEPSSMDNSNPSSLSSTTISISAKKTTTESVVSTPYNDEPEATQIHPRASLSGSSTPSLPPVTKNEIHQHLLSSPPIVKTVIFSFNDSINSSHITIEPEEAKPEPVEKLSLPLSITEEREPFSLPPDASLSPIIAPISRQSSTSIPPPGVEPSTEEEALSCPKPPPMSTPICDIYYSPKPLENSENLHDVEEQNDTRHSEGQSQSFLGQFIPLTPTEKPENEEKKKPKKKQTDTTSLILDSISKVMTTNATKSSPMKSHRKTRSRPTYPAYHESSLAAKYNNVRPLTVREASKSACYPSEYVLLTFIRLTRSDKELYGTTLSGAIAYGHAHS